MKTNALTPAFTTGHYAETREFYQEYFDARILFDCDWYMILEFGQPGATLAFMTPREASHALASGEGLTYNFMVDDVDGEHERLRKAGLEIVMPIDDHPWGDRGFSVLDPNGIALYIYSPREPSDEFKQYMHG